MTTDDDDPSESEDDEPVPAVAPGVTLVFGLALALAPAVAAVWWFPAFVTQDGPAHLYNARVLARSFDPDSPFRSAFAVRWEPLPNWAGHVVLMGLSEALPPRDADRAMTTLTVVALAASVLWLRVRVAGDGGRVGGPVLAALVGLNVTWLLGFSGFLLGASLFPLTLALWWSGRDEGWSAGRAWGLAGLVALGYFCHPVSLGLTVFGLGVLHVLTPGSRRSGRAAVTAAGLSPLAPLGLLYVRLIQHGGPVAPEWKHLTGLLSLKAWADQLTWVDPVSLARKDYWPLLGTTAPWHLAAAPVLWVGAGLALAVAATVLAGEGPFQASGRGRRGWWALAGLLLVGGAAGPDTLGPKHGEYLQQRVVLLGLVGLIPALRLDSATRLGRASCACLLGALAVQSAVVWDYGATSDRTAGAILNVGRLIGPGQRFVTRLTGIRTPFRANPILHADSGLGADRGAVVWGDYETRFYYFPVQFRDGPDRRPDPETLERIALGDPDRLRLWSETLEAHQGVIDVVLAWNEDPALDAVTARRYGPLLGTGPLRVWVRKRGR